MKANISKCHLLAKKKNKVNVQILAMGMFKVYRNMSPPIFSEIFYQRGNNYDL